MNDLINRQAAIEAIERNAYRHTYLDQIINIISNLPSAEVTLCHLDSPCEYQNADIAMPSAQPEQRICVNCGRTANNGGWYEDGRTRCPIEEHYALPKDGYCHLWEKRKDWEDDSVKRAEEGENR